MDPASGYERRIGRYSGPLASRMVELADLQPGQRVLDVGCGSGPLTEKLAAVVGARNVAAVDSSPPEVAASAARVPGAEVRHGWAEELPFADDQFDAVLAQLLVHLVTDPELAAQEMRRVARPGARVLTCVWDFANGMKALRAFWDAAAAVGAPGVERHDQQSYRYATAPELEELWRSAGLDGVSSGRLHVSTDYADFADLWEPLLIPDGSPGRFLATLDAETIGAIEAQLRRALGDPQGAFRLDAAAWYVAGTA